jgi:hypothetical protein
MNPTRQNGLLLFLGAGLVFVLLAFGGAKLAESGWSISGWGWGIPGAFAFAGLIQLVSGVPFSELSSRWDSLAGWQRGILGVAIVIASLVPLAGIMILLAKLLYE